MNALKTSPPEAPIAILTPISRTRSLRLASWMFTFTMPPPMRERMPGEHEDHVVDLPLALPLADARAMSSILTSSCWRWFAFRSEARSRAKPSIRFSSGILKVTRSTPRVAVALHPRGDERGGDGDDPVPPREGVRLAVPPAEDALAEDADDDDRDVAEPHGLADGVPDGKKTEAASAPRRQTGAAGGDAPPRRRRGPARPRSRPAARKSPPMPLTWRSWSANGERTRARAKRWTLVAVDRLPVHLLALVGVVVAEAQVRASGGRWRPVRDGGGGLDVQLVDAARACAALVGPALAGCRRWRSRRAPTPRRPSRRGPGATERPRFSRISTQASGTRSRKAPVDARHAAFASGRRTRPSWISTRRRRGRRWRGRG